MLRRLVPLLGLVALVAGCTLDEAEQFRAGAPQITAEVGQLRVISYDDDPASDRWIDVVSPDDEVVEEGDGFREADSRTADDDQPAEQRRLFTGVATGRTLLVTVDEVDDDVLVWDLAVGGADGAFSPGTDIARPGEVYSTTPGSYVVTVRPGDDAGGGAPAAAGLALVGSHEPADGADLYVDVYRAVAPGEFTVVHGSGGDRVEYPVAVG